VPEPSSNVAHGLSANDRHALSSTSHGRWLGLVEAFVLASVAIATAWSGYQAARWDGISSRAYTLYERYTVLSQEKMTLAGQDRLYDIITFNGWTAAKVAGRNDLAAYYQRRFRPEYAVAFSAWSKLNPFHNRKAPAGPIFMQQYKNANALEAGRLEAKSMLYFKDGVKSRQQSEDYVRVTVFLATVLFLTALSQRFEFAGPRAIIAGIAAILLLFSLFWIITLPRA